MREIENLFWHDGRLLSLHIERRADGYDACLVFELHESIDSGNKHAITLRFKDVLGLASDIDFLAMNQHFSFGHIEDGEISLTPDCTLSLRLVEGFIKIKSRGLVLEGCEG